MVVNKNCIYITDLNYCKFCTASDRTLLPALEVCEMRCWLAGMHILF